jgi:hypothetical protein
MDFVSDETKYRTRELAMLLTRSENVSKRTVEQSIRLLRPVSDNAFRHAAAVKQRIRQTIMRNDLVGNNGPEIVANFENGCEKLRRLNSALLQPFLALLEPLCFSQNSSGGVDGESTSEQGVDGFNQPNFPDADAHANSGVNLSLKALNIDSSSIAPLVPPYQFSDVDSEALEAGFVWVGKDTEIRLIRDLLYIFQVPNT